MKCPLVSNISLASRACCLLLVSFSASATIENTVYANYDLKTGKSAHHMLILNSKGQQSIATLVPFNESASIPSIFKITACTNRHAGSYTRGELHFDTLQTDDKDTRTNDLSNFVNEHNLTTWWRSIGDKMTLIHTLDPDGILIVNPDEFITNAPECSSR